MNKGKSISIFSDEALGILKKALLRKESDHLLKVSNSITTSSIPTSSIRSTSNTYKSTSNKTTKVLVEQQHVIGIRGKSYHYGSDSHYSSSSSSVSSSSKEEEDHEWKSKENEANENNELKSVVDTSLRPMTHNVSDESSSSLNDKMMDKQNRSVTYNTSNKKKRTKQEELVNRQMGKPPMTTILLDNVLEEYDSSSVLVASVPSVLLFDFNASTTQQTPTTPLQHLLSISNTLKEKYVLILTLQSGRFAAAIFHQMICIAHTTSTRYTTRKGQGGAQSSNDNAKGKAKSIGSQLRRAGEEQLRKDVSACLKEWYNAGYIAKCEIVFLSVSKSLQKRFWEDVDKILTLDKIHSGVGHDAKNIFYKKSKHVMNIPLDVGRPSYEGCCAIHEILTTIHIETMNMDQLNIDKEDPIDPMTKPTEEEHEGSIALDTIVEQDVEQKTDETSQIVPFTIIHSAVQDGNVEQLSSLLSVEEYVDYVDVRAGPDLMTPLHIAAASSNPSSNKCIRNLLLEGHANPGILDGRNRPPYFLATTESTRNAFRTVRAKIPDAWDWDACKVGPPLTEDDLKRKKEKASEKKRRQREKQKERKAAEEVEKLAKEEEAKRTRAGLQPKVPSSKPGEYSCDFCQKICKRKSQMFQRLDFYYCSTECVKRHQRELMAAAATARLGN
jgi:hypothetical protein